MTPGDGATVLTGPRVAAAGVVSGGAASARGRRPVRMPDRGHPTSWYPGTAGAGRQRVALTQAAAVTKRAMSAAYSALTSSSAGVWYWGFISAGGAPGPGPANRSSEASNAG